jgi:hypothetical protein
LFFPCIPCIPCFRGEQPGPIRSPTRKIDDYTDDIVAVTDDIIGRTDGIEGRAAEVSTATREFAEGTDSAHDVKMPTEILNGSAP